MLLHQIMIFEEKQVILVRKSHIFCTTLWYSPNSDLILSNKLYIVYELFAKSYSSDGEVLTKGIQQLRCVKASEYHHH
jgi:hypothetical protein